MEKLGAALNDSTTIPLGWMVAGIGATLTAFMVVSGTIIWAVRLEARGDFQANEINALKLEQKLYREDQKEVQKSLMRLELLLQEK